MNLIFIRQERSSLSLGSNHIDQTQSDLPGEHLALPSLASFQVVLQKPDFGQQDLLKLDPFFVLQQQEDVVVDIVEPENELIVVDQVEVDAFVDLQAVFNAALFFQVLRSIRHYRFCPVK